MLEFLHFLAIAHRNTYAAPKDIKVKYKIHPFLPAHECYNFKIGDWEYFDGFAGKHWTPGREVVLLKGVPYWAMSYQGKTVGDEHLEQAFDFLKLALRNFDDKSPFRGPSYFQDGEFEYFFEMEGTYEYFTGRESIKHNGKEIFFQNVMGELIK